MSEESQYFPPNAALEQRGGIHRSMFPDGRTKPPGMFDWQVTAGISDDEPLAGLGFAVFEISERVGGLPYDLAVERDEFAKTVLKPLIASKDRLEAVQERITSGAERSEAAVMASSAHLSAIVAIQKAIEGLGPRILAEFNAKEAAAILEGIVSAACRELPLAEIKSANTELQQTQKTLLETTESLKKASTALAEALPAHQELAQHVRRYVVRMNWLVLLTGIILGVGGRVVYEIIIH